MNVFERFKKEPTRLSTSNSSKEQVYFQLVEDEYGVYLQTVDRKGRPIEPLFQQHSGADRQVLRLLEQIQDRNSFVIDWEKPADHVYISEYEYLIESLKGVKRFVNAQMQPLQFVEGEGKLKLTLQNAADKENIVESRVAVDLEGQSFAQFVPLTENHLLAEQQIIQVASVGGSFASLHYFNSTLTTEELPIFLSLFFSHVEQIDKIVYESYRFVFSEEVVEAAPSLIFEKIDEDESLLMRVGQVLPELPIEVMQQFELYKYVEINDLEQVITVKSIQQEPLTQHIQEIAEAIKNQTPKRKKKEQLEAVRNGTLFIIPKEIAANFIYNELPELILRYQLFGAEKLKSYKISTVAPSVSMQLSHGIDYFEGDVTLDFDGEVMNLFDVLNQYRKNRYIQLSDGTHAIMNEKYIRRLERLFNKGKDKKAEVSFFDLPLVEELIDEKVTGTNAIFQRPREFYEGLGEKKKYKLPKINAKLRPYQKKGYKWLRYLHEYELGGCLADDMGLGKTLQAIALLAWVYKEGETKSSLIVMPRSLLYNWQREVAKFAPQLSTYIYHGNDRDFEQARQAQLILTTYAIARNDVELLKEVPFSYLVLDESQNIKNVNALTTKAIMLLDSEYRLALSGTPVENNLGELYSLFRFLNPSMFGTFNNYNRRYLTPIQKYGDKDAMRHLRKKIYPFVLRRLKKNVLKDLPDKIEQTLYVDMSAAQEKLYEQRRQFYQTAIKSEIATKGINNSQFFIFQALNELRQIASIPDHVSDGKVESPKREMLQQQLLDSVANGHKALVFTNYLAAVDRISQVVEEAGIDYVSMTGATRNRQQLVDRFQNDPNCRVFIMTLKTGGTGLNLTAADTIFIYDPWWNVAAEQQAIDRAHRIGQQNKVLAYKLITQNTIEEKIMQLQEVKKELFDNIITTDGAATKSLTEDDINFILGGV
ncbi:MAG: SNF2-related protein [Bacteroidota bacterium]